jgi:hypothetical protein
MLKSLLFLSVAVASATVPLCTQTQLVGLSFQVGVNYNPCSFTVDNIQSPTSYLILLPDSTLSLQASLIDQNTQVFFRSNNSPVFGDSVLSVSTAGNIHIVGVSEWSALTTSDYPGIPTYSREWKTLVNTDNTFQFNFRDYGLWSSSHGLRYATEQPQNTAVLGVNEYTTSGKDNTFLLNTIEQKMCIYNGVYPHGSSPRCI